MADNSTFSGDVLKFIGIVLFSFLLCAFAITVAHTIEPHEGVKEMHERVIQK